MGCGSSTPVEDTSRNGLDRERVAYRQEAVPAAVHGNTAPASGGRDYSVNDSPTISTDALAAVSPVAAMEMDGKVIHPSQAFPVQQQSQPQPTAQSRDWEQGHIQKQQRLQELWVQQQQQKPLPQQQQPARQQQHAHPPRYPNGDAHRVAVMGTVSAPSNLVAATALPRGVAAAAANPAYTGAETGTFSLSTAAAPREPARTAPPQHGPSVAAAAAAGDPSQLPTPLALRNSAQAQALHAAGQRAVKLRNRRGGISSSFTDLQGQLATDVPVLSIVSTRAAGLKHIGFGPFKRENQDEFFIQVGHYGSQPGANLFCVFDGHGSYGKDAASCSRQVLPALLDTELRKYFARNANAAESFASDAIRGAVEVLVTEVFGETEKSVARAGVNLASSGTTASVVFQLGNRLWVAAAGDSRVILCQRAGPGSHKWRPQPLTIDHRPRRLSERERVEAAGARVQPKRLPSGRMVGEPRLWLQEVSSPGLMLSRSLGDLMAATVGCTSDPEITYATLQPGRDQFVVLATDGVWDVLTNEQVCDIVVESPDPHIACRRVLDAALYEWEERMSADNITVLVVELDWSNVVAVRHDGPAVAQAVTPAGPASGEQLPAIREMPS